jgi:hypothetical protein
MVRRNIKADGACLFNCIGLALENSIEVSDKLRNIVA